MPPIPSIEQAVTFFTTNTQYTASDIRDVKQIHMGFTNLSYLVTLRDQTKFQIRFAMHNQIVQRDNELQILHRLFPDWFLHINHNGDFIKKWIVGYHPGFCQKHLLKAQTDAFVTALLQLQQCDVQGLTIPVHDYHLYDQYFHHVDKATKTTYQSIVHQYAHLPLLLTHSDLNTYNMLYQPTSQTMVFIDYEWSRLNNAYWDLAAFFKDLNLPVYWLYYMYQTYNPKLDWALLLQSVYVATVFSLLWTYSIPVTNKVLNYRKLMKKRLAKWTKITSQSAYTDAKQFLKKHQQQLQAI